MNRRDALEMMHKHRILAAIKREETKRNARAPQQFARLLEIVESLGANKCKRNQQDYQ